jgi:peptidoglycan/xylan/chitin deacetylase (PgdA/CDA1 family)
VKGTLRRLRDKLRGRWPHAQRGGVILAYHRIADVALDPSGLAVSPRRFEAHMEGLAHWARPRSLETLSSAAHEPALRSAVAVTLDDGYADNLTIAKPILERYEVPATVFIPSEAVGRRRGYWWDELEALVFGAHPLPRSLDATIGGERIAIPIGDDGGDRDRSGRYRGWLVWQGPARTPRQRLYTRLWQALRSCRAEEQRAALNALAEWIGVATPPAAHPTLDATGVRALLEGGLVEVGGHTATHPMLTDHPPALQREEIAEGRRRLEEVTGRSTPSFSYPYGAHDDATVALVREAGFHLAVTTEWGVVRPAADRYRLPRLTIGDWEPSAFQASFTRLMLR